MPQREKFMPSQKRKKRNPVKKILMAAGAVILALLLVVIGYVVYFFAAYYRIPDNQTLEIEGEPSDVVPVGRELTVMSLNFGFGAYSKDYSFFMDGGKYSRAYSAEEVEKNLRSAAAAIDEASPDFLLLQEVDERATRSHKVNERAFFTEKMDGFASVFAVNFDSPYLFYPIFSPHGKSLAGIMTFSSFGIVEAVRRSLPIEDSFMKYVDLDRCYSVCRIPAENGRELVLYNLHLSAYTSDGSIANDQLVMLTEDMRGEAAKGNYVIAGGDFNKDLLGDSSEYFGISGEEYTWAQPIPEGIIPRELTLIAPSNLPSCRNADRPYEEDGDCFVLTVDGFIVSENVEVSFVETRPCGFEFSDHNPVAMSFSLKG